VIIANRADVTGTNVVVDGTCADFAIVDNKPYKYNGAFSAASAKQTVTVSAAGFSTTVVPFNAAVPEGLKAYNVEAINADNTIAVEEVTSVEAGKPVLLEGEGTFTFEASGASVAASAGALSNGILTASYAGLDVTGGGYVLQNQEEGVAFYKFEGARSMKPFRAYIPATGASGAKTLNIGIGESTGVMALNHADATTAVRYNAAGQKLNGMQKGLNIVKMSNGEVKKVFVK
jgi:glucuronoarabinoxylan endo-1,4-beta-xylanase